MDTERVFATTARKFAEEDDAMVYFAHRHVIVFDASKAVFHLVQFVVVRGEEGARMSGGVFVDVLHDAPGDGDAIVGGSTATEFVKKNERTVGEIVHDVGGFAHFHHKCTFSHGDIVGSPHTSEDFVYQTHACAVGRNE